MEDVNVGALTQVGNLKQGGLLALYCIHQCFDLMHPIAIGLFPALCYQNHRTKARPELERSLYTSMHSKFHQLEHDSACTSAVQVSYSSGYHPVNIFSESSRQVPLFALPPPTPQSTRCLLSLLRIAGCWRTTSKARSLTPVHGFRMTAVGVRTPPGILEIPTEAPYMG